MAQQVLERVQRGGSVPIVFECRSCRAVLSISGSEAGVSGPCPLCGEWLDSPMESDPGLGRRQAFVSRRHRVPPVKPEPMPKLRPEGRLDWRERRERCDRLVRWFHRFRARLSVVALALTAALLAFMYSYGWSLPWTIAEDSVVMRLIDSMPWANGGGDGDGGGGGLPSGPRRR